ncbi:hypothetical protein NXF25_013858 [Crotalus adamanteus]|uniref:MHC class I antigen n=1 Tax=Crotalus adamanteus TaxID=8729 RepID=A0AAW1BA18_CROAD
MFVLGRRAVWGGANELGCLSFEDQDFATAGRESRKGEEKQTWLFGSNDSWRAKVGGSREGFALWNEFSCALRLL